MSNALHESSQASVSASLTQAVLHAASRLGLDRQALLSVCNLTDQQLADPDARIPFSVQQTLWHELDSRLQHPEPGLLLGRNLTPGPFSVLSYLLQSSATLGDALNAALRYQRLGGEGGERHIETRDDSLLLLYRPLHPQHPATRIRVLAMMACWVQMTTPLLDDFRLLGAQFRHAAAAPGRRGLQLPAAARRHPPPTGRTAAARRPPAGRRDRPAAGLLRAQRILPRLPPVDRADPRRIPRAPR